MTRSIVVQKYGGTSVGDLEKVRAVARRVVECRDDGHDVVVVVSAMAHTTDELVEQVRGLTDDPVRRELDVLLATGEHRSMALLALALGALGADAVSLTGAQCGIRTNAVHGNARILAVAPGRVRRELAAGRIVVAAGFQGCDENGETTTLGRGGSDTTAVALAAALGALRCEIYTDVDGVYSADPRVLDRARCLEEISALEMQEMAWHGARVLKAEAVELAASNGVDLAVGHSRGRPRTRVVSRDGDDVYVPKMPAVSGVTGRRNLLRVVVTAEAMAGRLHEEIFDALAEYDLIFGGRVGDGAFHLLLGEEEMPDVEGFRRRLEMRFGDAVRVDADLGAVSLIGFGIGSRPHSLLRAHRVLERLGVPVDHVFTGRESLSFVVPAERVHAAEQGLHAELIEALVLQEA